MFVLWVSVRGLRVAFDLCVLRVESFGIAGLRVSRFRSGPEVVFSSLKPL